MADLLRAFEFGCKTVRSIFTGSGAPTLPGPLDDGDLPRPDARKCSYCPVDDGWPCWGSCADALSAWEAETETLESRNAAEELTAETERLGLYDDPPPWWSRCAVEAKAAKTEQGEPTIERFGLKLTPSSFDRLGESLDRITAAERDAFRSGGQTYETGPRPTLSTPHAALCACGHWLHPANVCAECGCNNVRLKSSDVASAGASAEDPPRGVEEAPRGADSPSVVEKSPLPWSVADGKADWLLKGAFPGLVLDAQGVVIGRFDTIAQANLVVEAMNAQIPPVPFPCVVDDCPETFTSYADLNTHSYWEHLQDDPFRHSGDPLVKYMRYPGADNAGDFTWKRITVTSTNPKK